MQSQVQAEDNEITIEGTIQNIKSKPELNGQTAKHKRFLPNGRIQVQLQSSELISIKPSCFSPQIPEIIQNFLDNPVINEVVVRESENEAMFAFSDGTNFSFFHISADYSKYVKCDDGSDPPKYAFYAQSDGIFGLLQPEMQLDFARIIVDFGKEFSGNLECTYFKSRDDMMLFTMNAMYTVTELYYPEELKKFIPVTQNIMSKISLNDVSHAAMGILKLKKPGPVQPS